MESFLNNHGFKLVPVAGDGNCIFNSVLLQLTITISTLSFRRDICSHIFEFQSFYSQFLDISVCSFDSQLSNLKNPGHWNSDIGDLVACAICNYLNRRVIVLSTSLPTSDTIFTPSLTATKYSDIIILLNNNHYSAVLPTSRSTTTAFAPDLTKFVIDYDLPLFFKTPPSSLRHSMFHTPATQTNSNAVSPPPAATTTTSTPTNQTHSKVIFPPPAATTTTSTPADHDYSNVLVPPPDATTTTHTPAVQTYSNAISPPPNTTFTTSTPTARKYEGTYSNDLSPPSAAYDPSLDDPSIVFSAQDQEHIYNDSFLNFLPRNFHIPLDPKCSTLFNKFRKLQDKFIMSILHLSTLIIYHQNNFVPRGLILNCNSQALFSENFDNTLFSFWQNTLHNSSIVLLEHLINHYTTHLYRITPLMNNLLSELISYLDPISHRCVLARLKRYALRSWKSTIREKNRKLYLDLKVSNNLKFSDTLLPALLQNPDQYHLDFSKILPFNAYTNKIPPQSKNKTNKRSTRNRRFIKNTIFREAKTKLENDITGLTSVVNLSNYQLNEDETAVLSKNLKFCPTPENYDPVSLSCDLFKFARRLRLTEYHYEDGKEDDYDEDDITNHPKLKKPNHFTPLAGRDRHLDAFIEGVTSEVMLKAKKPKSSNLSDNQKIALDNLRKNHDITIKPADKGGAVVVQNTSDYIDECDRQLSDTTFYRQIENDPTLKYNNTIKSSLLKGIKQNEIDNELFDQLIEKNPTAARFYTVPKIHKPNNPGRPIISGNGCPTEKISVFVDHHLRPLTTQLDSYVQDNMDFLRHIDNINRSNIITPDTLLVTMDVSSLYTNIPHKDGTDACRHYLDTRQEKKPSTSFLCNLITLILTLNNFVFNSINFLQIQGTAMGTCMAPNYANLFMGKFETSFLESWPFKPLVWLRYIDDIFILWNEGRDRLLEFISAANDFHPTIKFTHDISNTLIHFLDITVHKTDANRLETDLYSKPTNAHLYLHYNSCHPRHTKNSLPFSLAYRLLRICSTENFLTKRLDELKTFLLNRQYKTKIIDNAFDKIRNLTRTDCLKRKNRKQKTQKRIPFITTFNPGLPNIPQILRKYLPTLHSSKHCRKAIPVCPIVSYKRPKNLKDILVNSKLYTSNKKNGFHKCSNKRCLPCQSALTGETVPIFSTNKTFTITKSLSCKSYNVIYLISCKRCKKQYIGKTETSLNLRVNNHRSFIKTKKQDPVAKHFYTDNHTFQDFQITAIDFIPHADTHTLCNKETFYIKLFNTIQPFGINSHSQNIYPIANY